MVEDILNDALPFAFASIYHDCYRYQRTTRRHTCTPVGILSYSYVYLNYTLCGREQSCELREREAVVGTECREWRGGEWESYASRALPVLDYNIHPATPPTNHTQQRSLPVASSVRTATIFTSTA